MRNYIQTYPNHKIWKINLHTKDLSVETNFQKESKPGIVSVEKDPVCWYVSALNMDAAARKFNARAKRYYAKVKSSS